MGTFKGREFLCGFDGGDCDTSVYAEHAMAAAEKFAEDCGDPESSPTTYCVVVREGEAFTRFQVTAEAVWNFDAEEL